MIVDEISTLDMNLEKKSLFIGSINAESKLTATLSVSPARRFNSVVSTTKCNTHAASS
jgi:hypothetical protein